MREVAPIWRRAERHGAAATPFGASLQPWMNLLCCSGGTFPASIAATTLVPSGEGEVRGLRSVVIVTRRKRGADSWTGWSTGLPVLRASRITRERCH